MEGENGGRRVTVAPDEDARAAVERAGPGGTVAFGAGVHRVSELSPREGQTWRTRGARFRPAEDAPAVAFGAVSGLTVGPIRAADPEGLTGPGVELVSFDGTRDSYVERVAVEDASVGVSVFGAARATRDNVVGSIAVFDAAHEYCKVEGTVRDNHVGSVYLLGRRAGTGGHGLRWATEGLEDGGNCIGRLSVLGVGGDGLRIVDLHRECWVGTAVLDSVGGCGLRVAPRSRSNRALFAGTLWVGGNAEDGLRVDGTGERVRGLRVGHCTAIGNGDCGWALRGLTDWQVGSLTLDADGRQSTGLRLGAGVAHGQVGAVRSRGHAGAGIREAAPVEAVHLAHVDASDAVETERVTTAATTRL